MPTQTTTPACCSCCSHFDEDTRRCTSPDGKLAGITLTDALADAQHDCPEFDEVRYRLTPAAILSLALEKVYGFELPIDEVQGILDEFMTHMERAGYIQKHEEE